MSLPNISALANDKKLSATGKAKSLNPDAAEFVPFSLRSPSGSSSATDASSVFSKLGGKAVLDRTESSVSNNSDDEAHQFWRQQLPDDITPDFKAVNEDDSQELNRLPFSKLSLLDINETSRFPASSASAFLMKQQQVSRVNNASSFAENLGYSGASYGENLSSPSSQNAAKPWENQLVQDDQLLIGATEGLSYNGSSGHEYMIGMLNEKNVMEGTEVNPIEFLASQFPGFAAESLAEVYFANEGDLNLTIEMLTQLELQVDGCFNENPNSKALSAPNLNAMDFPALSTADGQSGMPKFPSDDIHQNANPFRSLEKDSLLLFKSPSSAPSRGATDFASAVRKIVPQESSIWKYDRNGSPDVSIGSSRSSHVLASSYNNGGQGRVSYGNKFPSRGSARAAPHWLETGEAVANMYSEMREEARDHARLRNAYFEQARQAYLVGYKALAKELSVKGQLHNMQMKEAHGKAQESIYRQRNPVNPVMPGNGRGQEKLIDLHGLHVSEALHVLKRDLAMLRNAARTTNQRLQVYICVGTGHHTRGSRTPARLPIAVQRYLLEEEGLDFSEPQPGLLRVVIY